MRIKNSEIYPHVYGRLIFNNWAIQYRKDRFFNTCARAGRYAYAEGLTLIQTFAIYKSQLKGDRSFLVPASSQLLRQQEPTPPGPRCGAQSPLHQAQWSLKTPCPQHSRPKADPMSLGASHETSSRSWHSGPWSPTIKPEH